MDELATLEPSRLVGVRNENGRSSEAHRGRIDHEVGDAGALVIKSGRGGDRAGLRREAEVIRIVGDHSLVRLVELRDHPDLTELVLRDTGGPSLAAVLNDRNRRPSESLRLMADACETVARLHAAGWSHGRITADHVLLTVRGRTRLCSLRDATPIDVDVSVARSDRSALLRMVDDWVRSTSASKVRSAPVARLCAARVARSTRRLPDDPDPLLLARILRRCEPRQAPRVRAILVGLAISIPLAIASMHVLGRLDVPDRTGASPPPPAPSRSGTTTTVPTAVAVPATPATTPATSPATTVSEAVEVDGNTVTIGSRRFRLGAPGDVVAVGDWDCDGRTTAALLQRSTGAVHVFEDWATDAHPATGRLVATVDEATGISAPSDGCGPPVVSRPDGSTTQVALR